MAQAIRDELLAIAERLLANAGFTSQFKGNIYGILLDHVKIKFLEGASLGLAETHHLDAARRLLTKVEQQIGSYPGLVDGMVKYADQ